MTIKSINVMTGVVTVTQQDAPVMQDAATALAAKREVAKLSRADFFDAAYIAGYITASEAEQAAAGNAIPSFFADAVKRLPVKVQPSARIGFNGAAYFSRNHPLVALAAKSLNLTDEDVDDLFGIQP